MVTGEPLVALGTFEGLFASVGPFVVLEDVLVAERAVADLAGEDLIPGGVPLRGGRDGLGHFDAAVGLGRRAGGRWRDGSGADHVHVRDVQRHRETVLEHLRRVHFVLLFSLGHLLLLGQDLRGRGHDVVIVGVQLEGFDLVVQSGRRDWTLGWGRTVVVTVWRRRCPRSVQSWMGWQQVPQGQWKAGGHQSCRGLLVGQELWRQHAHGGRRRRWVVPSENGRTVAHVHAQLVLVLDAGQRRGHRHAALLFTLHSLQTTSDG